MTKVEEVARAIRAADMAHAGVDNWPVWEEMHPPHRDLYLLRARAAIEAMRVPTEAMIDIGSSFGSGLRHDVSYEELSEAYTAMIDAALEEPN